MLKKLLVMTLVLALASFISLGCKKEQPKPKAPASDTSKTIDKAAEDAKKAAGEAAEKVGEAAEKTGDAAQKAADELKK